MSQGVGQRARECVEVLRIRRDLQKPKRRRITDFAHAQDGPMFVSDGLESCSQGVDLFGHALTLPRTGEA